MINWKSWARWRWEAALIGCILVSLGVLAMSETGHNRLTSGYDHALRSLWATGRLGEIGALVVDAESSLRGFLLTRRETYLDPYNDASERLSVLQAELHDYYVKRNDRRGLASFGRIVEQSRATLGVLEQSVRLARTGQETTALELLDAGERRMDELRASLAQMQVLEREVTGELVDEWRASLLLSRIGIAAITALNIVLLVLILRWLKQDWHRAEARERDLDRKIETRTTQLASLSTYLQEAIETEKTRLGRELHDELGAILTAARMDLLWIRGRLAPEQTPLREKLHRALNNLEQGITLKRRIIEDLRPSILATFGLMTAARDVAQQAADQAGWQLDLELPDTDPDLEDEVEVALFRILQESLTNAAKYAKATRMRVMLQYVAGTGGKEGRCTLEVEDNGRGFRSAEVSLTAHGLVGMRQRIEPRGGSLLIRSDHGQGTLVQAILPVRLRIETNLEIPAG